MKKILGLFLGILMVFVVVADALAEISVGGTIDVRGRWRENNNDLNKDGAPDGTANGSTAYWEQKVNLWVDAKIAEGLKGYVELQSAGADGFQTWGASRTNTDTAPNSLLNENRGLSLLEIRYAYIDFMIPKIPVGIKIGHFPVVLGHSIWADTSYWGSDGLLIYSAPIKELMIALGTLKGYETASNTNRTDADLYVLMANYTFMPKNTVGANASYLLRAGARGQGKALANEYWSDLAAGGAANDTPNSGAFDKINNVRVWNIMLTADGAFDFGLGYKFEIDKQFGRFSEKGYEETYDNGTHSTNFRAGGLAFLLGVNYGIAEIAEVRFNAAYGSGDKCGEWSASTAGGTVNGDACKNSGNRFEGYLSFNNYGYTMIYEDIVGQKTGISTMGSGDFGLYNTMYINVGAGVTPLKDMSVGLDIYYLRAMKEFYYGQKKNIGWEVDLNFGYQIYKNLKWTLLAGYFLPGNHYKAVNSTDTVKDDAAWAFEQVLSLSF